MFALPMAKIFQNSIPSCNAPRPGLGSKMTVKRSGLLCLVCFLFSAWGCQRPSSADVRIPVVMKKYTITPEVIRVKSGQKVELDVTTADVQHGLDIPDLGIKEPVQ